MSVPHRGGDRAEPHPPATSLHGHAEHPHARRTRVTPHPDVVAAVEFLLTAPDAYLYRRRSLDLIIHTSGPDGTTLTDYSAAEKYLLTTAATARRNAAHRTTTLHPVHTSKPKTEDGDGGGDRNP